MGSVCHGYMCILLYVKLLQCSGFPEIYAWLERGMESVCHGYMCILLYVKLIWCIGLAQIYGWLEEGAWGQSAMGICAFFYMSNFCSVVVFQRSMLDWRRGHGVSLPWVYVHSSICQTYLVYWSCTDLCLIGGGGMGSVCHGYLCILLYVKPLQCSSFPEIYASLEDGAWSQSAMAICAFFYLSNFCSVVVFQRSMLDWRGAWGQSAMGICAFFSMWNLFGVLVLHRSMVDWRRGHGVNLPWVYVHSSICQTFAV